MKLPAAAMDNGLTQSQAAEVITHLAFYAGWPNAFSALPVAVLSPRPLVIGLGYPCTAITPIFPQPHDIPMDWIVTGTLPAYRRESSRMAVSSQRLTPRQYSGDSGVDGAASVDNLGDLCRQR